MEFIKKHDKTAVLLISPETGRLPEKMTPLARYISGKSGGLGEVISALCDGLIQRGIECHLAVPYLIKMRFQHECGLNEGSWDAIRNHLDPERIHLVNSSIFFNLSSIYAGNPLQNAAEFQKQVVNHIITTVRAKNAGKLIVHSHDWMAGGIITAYAKIRGCPVLHTVHNIHTGLIPPEMFFGVNMDPLTSYLYFFDENGRRCIAWSSGWKIVYNRFSEPLSMLGFAAASDVFGASLYEPCGQIDQLGNLYGATATNRDTGGYHDKIQELTLIDDGALKDSGNGFLFRDYDAGGLWYGLHRSVEFHSRPAEVRERNLRRIMRETRQKHSMDRMVDEYIAAYERLNGGLPLV